MNLNLPHIPLSKLLAGLADICDADNVPVTGVSIDSRHISSGDLFIALPGSRQHGNEFINAAIAQGVSAVIYDASSILDDGVGSDSDVPLIKVADISRQAGIVASRFYGEPSRSMKVIGITGTNGKTTCSLLLAQCLNHLGSKSAVIGTLGVGLVDRLTPATHTTPDALTLQKQMAELRDIGVEQLLVEVSSHGLMQGRESGTEFNVAVLTNLSQDHLDYHGNMQNYAAAKAKLFYRRDLAVAVINSDDEFGKELLAAPLSAGQVVSYGIDSGDVRASRIHLHKAGIELSVDSRWGKLHINSRLMGRFNVYNLLACAAVLLSAAYRPEKVAAALSVAGPAAGRMQVIDAQGVTVVIDFAHTPDALQQVLTALREHITGRHLICVFGCGGDRDQAKRPVMGRIAGQLADTVIVTDDNPRHEQAAVIRAEIIDGMATKNSCLEIADRRQAIKSAWQMAKAGDIILIAGKGHESSQQVGDLNIPFSDYEVIAGLISGKTDAEEHK